MSTSIVFDRVELGPECSAFRQEIREFLREEGAGGSLRDYQVGDDTYCPEFSQALGRRGWLGLTWPKAYGGHERSALERYVLNEELLVARAPTTAHFVAERQSGPLVLRFGSEEQRERYARPITRGELTFCIGMSEANSGSDLASVETSGRRVDGGWILNGAKLWTSWAHRADYMITLVRTTPLGGDRHDGLSQFIVDLSSPGIEIRPIIHMSGEHHFNEVVLSDCFVPDDTMVGEEGNGWRQVTSELGYERSGPERFLSTFGLFMELTDAVGSDPTPEEAAILGRIAAHLITLRRLSISVAGMLQQGKVPSVEAALVKDLGTHFERMIPEVARLIRPASIAMESPDSYGRALSHALFIAPQLTIQGGSREILRSVVARGLGV